MGPKKKRKTVKKWISLPRPTIDKLDDAEEAGESESKSKKCTLILTVGNSSRALARVGLSVLGRKRYGVFGLRGTIVNVRESTHCNNTDMVSIMEILGLHIETKNIQNQNLRYGRVMIMTDPDPDGIHIKGLLISFFHYYWPNLLKDGRLHLSQLITTAVKATHATEGSLLFYSQAQYEGWKKSLTNDATEWAIKYYNGLGTNKSEEAKEYFSDLKFHERSLLYDEEQDGQHMELAFGKGKHNVAARKEWLYNHGPLNHLEEKKDMTFSDFVLKELICYFLADLERSIPSMIDGLKTGSRKILFSAFKRNLVKDTKVSHFSGYVAEHAAYHHGEQSLVSTIISMAQNFVGRNNINLLQPNGQFGTRTLGGEGAAKARHIFTMLSPITRVLFQKDDDVLLNYLNEDGQVIEPKWYVPIIPTILVNGCEGVASGWSSDIPSYNPRDIVANVRRRLKSESMVPMDPWYRGFKGTVEKIADGAYQITGVYEDVDDTTIRITELPVSRKTDAYKNFLLGMKEKNEIKNFRDSCVGNSVDFVIKLNEAEKASILEKFKLTQRISTGNMYLFDQKGIIKKYGTPEQILEEFFYLRLAYYEMRKEIMLKNLNTKLVKLRDKEKFIRGVLEGGICIVDREKSELVQELRQKGFTPSPEESSVGYYEDLLTVDIASLTRKKVQELVEEIGETDRTFKGLSNIKPECLWLRNLDSLDMELDKLEDAQAEREAAQPKTMRRRRATKKLAPKKASESKTTEASNDSKLNDFEKKLVSFKNHLEELDVLTSEL